MKLEKYYLPYFDEQELKINKTFGIFDNQLIIDHWLLIINNRK
jgi:hypothetical protein